jgi:hypothetical protein
VFLCAAIGSCTLANSLDELQDNTVANGGQGGGDGSLGGSSGSFPGGTGGNDAASESATGGSAGGTSLDPPWWDASWPDRVQLFIQNQSALPLAEDFEVGVEIPSSLFGAGSTFAVVRWDQSDLTWTPRPTHYELLGSTFWIWTPLVDTLAPNDVASSLYLYVGKPDAPQDDPASVFTFWDGFDTTSGEWVLQGAPSLGGGQMLLPHDSSIRSSQQWDPGFAVDYALQVDADVSVDTDWISAGFQRTSDFDNTEPWLIWVSREPDLVRPEVQISAVNASGTGVAESFTTGSKHFYGVERFPTKTVFRLENVITEELTWTTPYVTPTQVRFTTQSTTAQITLDFVRVRRASDPPPLVTLGPSQSR